MLETWNVYGVRRRAGHRVVAVSSADVADPGVRRCARRTMEHDVVTVILPEFVVHHWWDALLHNQSALLLKARLLLRKGTVVTSIPTHVD